MTITEIKTRLSILSVVEQYGLKPDAQQRLLCVWHQEETPSLQLYPGTNTFCCFSAKCSAGTGDVIDFIMKYENTTKYQAILKAKSLVPQSPAPSPAIAGTGELNEQHRLHFLENSFAYFSKGLKNSPTGNDYLQSRGLDKELLAAAGVKMGYNSGQWLRGGQEELVKNALLYGLLLSSPNQSRTGGTGYNIFAKLCILFALCNSQGKTVSFYGRSVYKDSKNKHFYLKNRQGLFPAYPAPGTRQLILTESIIDAATLIQLQHLTNTISALTTHLSTLNTNISVLTSQYSILACYGTNGLTDEHLDALSAWAAPPHPPSGSPLKGGEGGPESPEIIFFFDGDSAGREAVKKHSFALHQLLPHVCISTVPTPDGEDINSFYNNYPQSGIQQLLSERVIVYQASESKTDLLTDEKSASSTNEESSFNAELPEALLYQNPHLQICVLGGIQLSGLDRLRVTLKIKARHIHYQPLRQNLDLYLGEQLQRLIRSINEQLDLPLSVASAALQELIEKLEQHRLERIASQRVLKPSPLQLSETASNQAITYLKQAELMQQSMDDIGKTGLVGESNNRLIMFLVFLSRITSDPLHLISFGSSGSGKTYLQEGIARLIPAEDKLEITSLSGNALYYFKQDELKHKLLLIEDYDGAQEVLYPLRELQSKQKISKTVSLKDSKGNIRTLTLVVEGPVCVAGCSTRELIYEDNANRSLLLYLDNSPEQDERIMDYQRRLSAGLINQDEERSTTNLLQNVQRVLKAIRVVNPFAPQLKIPDKVFKPRRSNRLYLRFIELVTLYHQYQRQIKTGADGLPYIETTCEDIAWANKLLQAVLIRKSDELSQCCRAFLETLKQKLQSENKSAFKSKEIRSALRIHPSSLKKHLHELHANGYIKISGGNRFRGFVYEVLSYEEYEELQKGVAYFLENLLEKIRFKN